MVTLEERREEIKERRLHLEERKETKCSGVLSKGSVLEVNSKYIRQKTITNSICALLYKLQSNTWK